MSCARATGLALSFLLWNCAFGPKPSPAPEEIGKVSPDRSVARMVASGEIGLAQKTSDSLLASGDPWEREAGAYWKAVCLLYLDKPDSALAIFRTRSGTWKGGLRSVHSEAFLRLSRMLNAAQASAKAKREELAVAEKSMQDKIDGLHKETGDLRAEIARLETEKQKYEKLLKDLETIR